jgi:hypothetical protein
MPLLPYWPVIVWMGMIQVVLDAAHGQNDQSIDDPANLTAHRGRIIPFPTRLPLSVA